MKKKERFLLLTLLVGMLLAGSVYLYGGKPGTEEAMALREAQQAKLVAEKEEEARLESQHVGQIKVHVKGEVQRPGVYQIPADSRVIDAITAAGGPKEGADVNALNLAAEISDGAEVSVPLTGAAAKQGEEVAAKQAGKINLNTATVEELDKMPGIGSTRAQAIVDYRTEHGRFLKVEDLKNIPGFGVKLVEQIQSEVVVQ